MPNDKRYATTGTQEKWYRNLPRDAPGYKPTGHL